VNFVSAYNVANLTALKADGLLGLSPRLLEQEPGSPVRESIIYKFFEEGTIEQPIFSLYLRDEFEESKMIIGGYDEDDIIMRGTKRIRP